MMKKGSGVLKKKVFSLLFVTMLTMPLSSALAADVPNIFVDGDTASASAVNANFKDLSDRAWEKAGAENPNINYGAGNVGIGVSNPGAALQIGRTLLRVDPVAGACPSGTTWVNDVVPNDGFIDAGECKQNGLIVENGSVGIGTTSPTHKLDVAGSFGVGGNIIARSTPGSAKYLHMGYDEVNDYYRIRAYETGVGYKDLLLQNPTSPMMFKANGNVGIGTGTPASKLHISGDGIILDAGNNLASRQTSLNLITLGDGATTVGNDSVLGWHLTARGDRYQQVEEQNDLILYYWNGSGWMLRQYWDNAGNVGIGTANPSAKLNTMPIGNLNNNGVLDATKAGLLIGTMENGIAFDNNQIERTMPSPASLFLNHNSSANVILVTGGGNVGIGTSLPKGKLDVNGAIYQRGGALHADYVFEETYKLESIRDHTEFMWKNKHLKGIPKAKVDENGLEIVEVGSHRKGIVEELEKAHIYISQLEEKMEQQNRMFKAKLVELEALLKTR